MSGPIKSSVAQSTDVNYPDSFPYDAIKEIVRITTTQSVVAEKAVYGKCIWVVQGYAQSQLLGNPDTQVDPVTPDNGTVGTTDHMINLLQDIMVAHERGHSLVGAQALVVDGAPLVKMSLPAPMAMLLKWSVSQLMILLQQEIAAAII